MSTKGTIGSYTAKGGFENEQDVVIKFNNYQNDKDAQCWLKIMGYDFKRIELLTAVQIPTRINRVTALSLGVREDNLELFN